MPDSHNAFDCLLITRPQPEAHELASLLALPGLRMVLQPAHEFSKVEIKPADAEALRSAASSQLAPLLVFTSKRAVHFALLQLPQPVLAACRLAAVGSATAAALHDAGFPEVIQPAHGYTSEDLLATLDASRIAAKQAWVVAAAGGRTALLDGLRQRGLNARMLLVYQRRPAALSATNLQDLEDSRSILSVWTSADAMRQLSKGLSRAAWQQVCRGEWLVVSQRLARCAEEQGASVVRQAAGPGNAELAAAITEIFSAGQP